MHSDELNELNELDGTGVRFALPPFCFSVFLSDVSLRNINLWCPLFCTFCVLEVFSCFPLSLPVSSIIPNFSLSVLDFRILVFALASFPPLLLFLLLPLLLLLLCFVFVFVLFVLVLVRLIPISFLVFPWGVLGPFVRYQVEIRHAFF